MAIIKKKDLKKMSGTGVKKTAAAKKTAAPMKKSKINHQNTKTEDSCVPLCISELTGMSIADAKRVPIVVHDHFRGKKMDYKLVNADEKKRLVRRVLNVMIYDEGPDIFGQVDKDRRAEYDIDVGFGHCEESLFDLLGHRDVKDAFVLLEKCFAITSISFVDAILKITIKGHGWKGW
jgi:hypothetical protein